MNFFVLNNPGFEVAEYAYGEEIDLKTGDAPKCSVCGGTIGDREWLPPLKAKLSKTNYGDLVFGTFTYFLASERFMKAFIEEKLIGIKEFRKVDIAKISYLKKSSPRPPEYYEAKIIRSEVLIDEKKSQIIRKNNIECLKCRNNGKIKTLNGIYITEKTWSGEDIFYSFELLGTVLVSEKFREFVRRNSFLNVELIPSEEYIPPSMQYEAERLMKKNSF